MRYVSIDIETTGIDRENCQVLEIGAIVEDCANPKSFEESPKIRLILERDWYQGQPYAINMNARIFKLLAQAQDIKDKAEREEFKRRNDIYPAGHAVQLLWAFLYVNGFGDNYTVLVSQEQLSENSKNGVSNAGLKYEQAMAMAGGDQHKLDIPKPNKRPQLKVNVAGKNFANFDKVFLEKIPEFTDLIRFRQRILDPVTTYADFLHDEEAPNMEKCFTRLGVEKKVSHDALEDAWNVITLLRPLYSTFDFRLLAMNRAHFAPGRV